MKKFRKIITIVAVLSLMNSAFSLIVSADDNVISADTIMNDEKSSDKEPIPHKDLVIETARFALESDDKAENIKLYFELAEGEKIEDYLLPDTECDDTEYNVYILTADKDTCSKYIDMFENDKDNRIKHMFIIHENPLSPEVRKSNVVANLRGFLERRYDDFEWLKMTFELAEGEKIEDYLLPDTEYKKSNGKYILTASKETYSKYIDIFENDVDNRIVNCDFFAPVMAENDFEVREYIIGDINSDNDSEKITDPKAIYDILAPFVEENFAKEVVVTYNSYDKEEDIQEHVSIRINNPPIGASASYETEIVNAIENFMNENNIISVPILVYDDARALDWDESDFSNVANMTTGDINSDGKVDVTDLSELSLALVGDKVLTEAQQKAADVDGDGAVKLADLAKYRQYLSKVISSLG